MPVETNITASNNWFRGTDKDFAIAVKQSDGTTAQTMTGWTLLFEILDAADAPTALISKSPTITSSAGTDDLATASVADTDSEALVGDATYHWRLRRTDAGFEDIYAFGTAYLRNTGL